MTHSIAFTSPYVTVTLEPEAGLLRYERNAVPYPSVEAVRAQHRGMLEAFSKLDPKELALLIDVRSAPPRNDEAFEAEVTRAVGAMLGKCRAHAFLVRTAVGTLQVKRLSGSSGIPESAVFTDEAAARAFLSR